MNNQTITGNGISQASLVNYVNRVLNLGLDVHYRQVTVAMQEDGGRIKSAGKMGHVDFLNWVQKKLQEGWQIYSCYEAGASGYTASSWESKTWWWFPRRWGKEAIPKGSVNKS